jgi:hypothetical protein
MDATFCVEALEAALARFGEPEIFNTVSGAPAPRCLGQRVWDDGASFAGGGRGSLSKSFAN